MLNISNKQKTEEGLIRILSPPEFNTELKAREILRFKILRPSHIARKLHPDQVRRIFDANRRPLQTIRYQQTA